MSTLSHSWAHDGYVVVRNLLPERETTTIRGICEDVLAQWRKADPAGRETPTPDSSSLRHLNHPGYFLNDHRRLAVLLDLIADERILTVVRQLFGEEPLFRCTSLFMNPQLTSTDGQWHRDSQFLVKTVDEEKRLWDQRHGFRGVQLQIALVPSSDIEYVPGSNQRWDSAEEFAIRRADMVGAFGRDAASNHMPNAYRAHLQAGDAAAFDAYGLHRGRYHVDKLRRTLMLTYTTASQPYFDHFSDQPWFLEPGYLDGTKPETRRFLQSYIEAYRSFWQENLGKAATAASA
jgi:hypothetical protein